MDYYDVVIIGGGVAGTGLAYSLKKHSYTGKVLIIDKKEAGSNAGHGIRTTFEGIVNKYGLPFKHKFKGVKIFVYHDEAFTVDRPCYSICYKDVCSYLLKSSSATFLQDKAINVNRNILITEKGIYRFKYLVDCSGIQFFMKRKLKKQLPFFYWVGSVRTVKNENIMPTDYLYYMTNGEGFAEEINPYSTTASLGSWSFKKEINFDLLSQPEKQLHKKLFSHPIVTSEGKGVIPVSPAFPCVCKNIAFLGDSFGTASSAGFGIGPALDSADILARALCNNNLKLYEKEWKRKYLSIYIKYLASKSDLYLNSAFMKNVKKYPPLTKFIEAFKPLKDHYYNAMEDPTYSLSFMKKFRKLFPLRRYIFLGYSYLVLRIKYVLMK